MVDENRVLYTASAGGYSAACDAFVRSRREETDNGTHIYFLSLIGSQTAVRAISAAMCKQRPDRVHLIKGAEPEEYEGGYEASFIEGSTLGTWTIKHQKLPLAKGYHCLVYTRLAEFNFDREEFILIARNEEEAKDLHYQFLDRRSPLPFSPDWSEWLWLRAHGKGEITRLDSQGVLGYYCQPDFERMAGDLGKGIRSGRLTA